MISVGTVSRRRVAMFLKGIGWGWAGLVIGMSRRVSTESISSSKYWTPTKYWFLLTGSIQKFFLWNWMLELSAATTFFITSTWLSPRSATLARSTSMTYSG